MTVNISTAHQFAVIQLDHDALRLNLYEDANDGHPWKALGWLHDQRLNEEFDSCTELLDFVAELTASIEGVPPSSVTTAQRRAARVMS